MKEKNRKGAASLTGVMIIMIIMFVTIYALYISVTYGNKYDIQGIMDDSGVISLRYAVDDNETMKQEKLIINKRLAEKKYRELLERQIPIGSGGIIDYNIAHIKIYDSIDAKRRNIPGSEKYDQAYIESIVRFKYDSISDIIEDSGMELEFYNFFTGKKESAVVSKSNENGITELVLRSVSRFVYE